MLISLPFWGGRADMRTIVEIAYYLALAQLWNLLAGYAGLVSVGQQAFLGLGGYALFVFAMNAGVHPIAAIPLAGIAAALFAVPTAFIVFRLRGAYFAIGTWVVAEVYMLSFAQVSALGGGSGMSLPAAVVRGIAAGRMWRETAIYWTGIAIAVGAIALVYLLLRSRHGLALTAIRDSEEASGSLGVDNFRTKIWVYIVAAFGTGMVGALVFLTKLRISPEAGFNVIDWTANVIFIVVIGGNRHHRGADHRRHRLLRAARAARGLRQLVPDRARRDCGADDAARAAGRLGPDRRALRYPLLPGAAAPRVRPRVLQFRVGRPG